MDWTLEVVVVPVASRNGGVDRAIAFYRDQLGFHLDHHTETADMNFAQLTPPGSGCSIVIGELPGGPASSVQVPIIASRSSWTGLSNPPVQYQASNRPTTKAR